MASPGCPAEAEYHGRAPSEKETEKERVSDDNRDRPGRSGLPPNLDFEREGHRDDRARYQPGVGHAGLWHSQRGLLASNRATGALQPLARPTAVDVVHDKTTPN